MKTQNNPITESTTVKNNPDVKKNGMSPLWQSVLVGGVPGILIGVGGTMGVEAMANQAEDTGDVIVEEKTEEVALEIHEAHSVTDDMSFSEAFTAARNEVGPGGAFIWHGQVYGTYRADDPEWQEMSAEDRTEHSQAILSQVHPAPYTPTENEPVIEPASEDQPNDEPAGDDPGQDGVDVHFVDVVPAQLADGTVIPVGIADVNGHYAEFADTDGDGEVDAVFIDVNDNQMPDEGEVIPMPNSGLTVDDMVVDVQVNNSAAVDDALYGDMPDYTNDADTSSLA